MELQVGVKILLKNKEGKYLIVRRSSLKYPEVGSKWDIVGGRIDKGTGLIENLRREVKEETGLEITSEPELLDAQDILRVEGKHIVRLTYVGEADGEIVLSDEHDEYKWATLEEIFSTEPMDIYFKKILEKFYAQK